MVVMRHYRITPCSMCIDYIFRCALCAVRWMLLRTPTFRNGASNGQSAYGSL